MKKNQFALAEYKCNPAPKIEDPFKDIPNWHFKPNYIRAMGRIYSWKKSKNKLTERFYFEQLEQIKALIRELPNEQDRLICERNRKREFGNYECLHEFVSPQVRFDLSCDFDLCYKIEYFIPDSSINPQIQAIIALATKRDYYSQEVKFRRDFNSYYQAMLRLWKEFISIL